MNQPKTGKFQMFEELPEDRYQSLKQGIREEGVRVPVEIDQHGQVIDGHHRIRAWNELRAEGVDIPDYPRIIREFDSDEDRRYAAISINSQRRDISEIDRKEKAALLRADGRSYRQIADALGVNASTVLRWMPDEDSGVAGATPEQPERVVGADGKSYAATTPKSKPAAFVTNSREQERALAAFDYLSSQDDDEDDIGEDMPPVDEDGVIEHIGPSEPKAPAPHVSHNSGENEWYTPSQYIEAAREVLGTIDLDPASSDIANERVKATSYFTKEDNGLSKEWHGNVWMNPPYAQPLIGNFAEKVVEEFDAARINAAIVLVNNATDTKWFRTMEAVSPAICFTPRIRFIDPDGNPSGAPLQGQAILYMGDDPYLFARVFRQFGFVRGVI